VQTKYRLYCVACGRATDVEVAASHASRCQTCGGSMLLEPSE
jgi:rRNA maturation endonuclease Nob1